MPYDIDSPARSSPVNGDDTAPITPCPNPLVNPLIPCSLAPYFDFVKMPLIPFPTSEPNP